MSNHIATIEKVLQTTIFPDLLRGRVAFDLPHTKAVVYWMKKLLKHIDHTQDPIVMITAAYAHDWGYIGLFDGVNSSDPREIAKRKPLHMERGAKLIGELLTTKLHDFFTLDQIKQVQHLVYMHDRVEDLHSEAEIMIMEADTLGMLDVDRVTPSFSAADNIPFMLHEVHGRRFKHFVHPFALKQGQILAKKRDNYYLLRESDASGR